MSKEERLSEEEIMAIIEGKLNRYNKFNSGFVVNTYDGADIKDLQDNVKESIEDIKATMGKVDYSMFIDKALEENVLDYYKVNGVLHTDSIVLVNHNYSQKDAEDRAKNKDKTTEKKIAEKEDKLKKLEEREKKLRKELEDRDNIKNKFTNKSKNDLKEELQKDLQKASKSLEELIKDEDKKLKALDRQRRRYAKKIRDEKVSKAESKYADKYAEIMKEYKKQDKYVAKIEKEYNSITKSIEDTQKSINRMKKSLKETEIVKGAEKTLNRQQVDNYLVKNGFDITRQSYTDKLNNKIKDIKKNYKDEINKAKDGKDKQKLYKDRDKEITDLVAKNPKEVINTKIHYKYHPHTSSKGRNIKDIYVEEYRIVNDGEKDYTYSIANNKNVVDRMGIKEEAINRYEVYEGMRNKLNINDSVIEELNTNRTYFLDNGKEAELSAYLEEQAKLLNINKEDMIATMDSRNEALFQLVEYDSYNSLNQSAVTEGYTKSIMPENIAIIDDLTIDIKCDAMVESLLDENERGYVLVETNKESYKLLKDDKIKYNGAKYTVKEFEEMFKKEFDGEVEFKFGYGNKDKEKKTSLKVKTTKEIEYKWDEENEIFVGSNGDKKTLNELKELNATPRNGKAVYQKDNVKLKFEHNFKTKNTMWDGMCLLDESVWSGESKFALLRNEMFKSGATKMKLQDMIKDTFKKQCKAKGITDEEEIDNLYNEATIKDVYGSEIKLKDIKMLTTTNSSKFDKFAKFKYPNSKNPKADLKKDWDRIVEQDGGLFGIVKTEHASKFDELQQLSYQMWNSFNFGDNLDEAKDNMITTLKDEIDRINDLKEYDAKFIEYLENKTYKKVDGKLTDKLQSEFDNDQYILKMVERNADFLETKEFREFKSKEISQLKQKLIRGKAKFMGDNMTLVGDAKGLVNKMFGNVTEDNIDKFIIFDNEPCDYVKIFSPKFAYNEKVVMMRSPHTGDFSIVVAQNKYNPEVKNEIEKYIDLGDNLCIVDNTKKAFQDLTAGSDLDLR